MGIFNQYLPVSVQELIDHWKTSAATNPLWSDEERGCIMKAIQAIEGKTKADAIKVLQPLSVLPTLPPLRAFAYLFLLDLKHGK